MKVARNRGFTLVEMAIVLVIIGIILAGVMKGRDIVRGAQVKQFSQQFAQKWATIAQTYYDKTGQLLLDGTGNGGNVTVPNGLMDGGLATRITDTTAANLGVQEVLESVGITPCTLIKSKLTTPVNLFGTTPSDHCQGGTPAAPLVDIVQTTVEGEYAGNRIVQAELLTLLLDLGNQNLRRNLVILYNVPTDVAQGLDTAVDGKVDGASGSCIGLGDPYAVDSPTALTFSAGTPTTATAWGDAATAAEMCQTVGLIMDY